MMKPLYIRGKNNIKRTEKRNWGKKKVTQFLKKKQHFKRKESHPNSEKNIKTLVTLRDQ